MVSKREKNFILKIDPIHVPTNLNMADIAKKLREHLNKLYNLIDKVRQVHLNETLDITHGSMASQTAEAVFLTLNNGITFLRFVNKNVCPVHDHQIAGMLLWTFNSRGTS